MRWLVFFYSVPSQPVSNRMKIWRRLTEVGALFFKGSVYLLPYNEEHYEFCQWLVAQTEGVGGEASFAKVEKIENVPDSEIIKLFNKQREREYRDLERRFEELEFKIQNSKSLANSASHKKLREELTKLGKDFETIWKRDFFSSEKGLKIRERLERLQITIKELEGQSKKELGPQIGQRDPRDYQGKIWVTRKRPFVDRMASAWLIKKFIDPEATFRFVEEKEILEITPPMIAFDMLGGEFTHVGDLCTFEVLLRAFNLTDKRLKKIAEIVHELDINDDKFKTPEAKGIEQLLMGIRNTAKSDEEALERGMELFELLYRGLS